MAEPARAVALPNLSGDDVLVYLPKYYAARQSGKTAEKARQTALRAVKAAQKTCFVCGEIRIARKGRRSAMR